MENWKINLAASWGAQFLCIVGFTAAFPFTPFFIRELGVSEVDQVALWAGMIASAGSVAMALISPVWGMMADRHGRKLMVERAAFGGAIIMTVMAFSASVEQLLVLRILQGLLTGTIPAFVALVASFSPRERIGFSLGLMQMAVYTGLSVGPLIGGVVADQVGYRWTFVATGVFLLVAALLVYFLVEEQFERPSEEARRSHSLASAVRRISASLPMFGAIVALGGIYLGNSIPQPVLPLFVESLQHAPHLVNTTTGIVYGANALASALSAAFVGHISDRTSYRTVLMACCLGSVLAFLGQAATPNVGWLLVASFATGVFAGGLLPAANAILARLAPRDEQGAIYGISNSVNSGGRAVGPMIGAALLTISGMRAVFVGAAVLFVLVLVWTVAVIAPHERAAERTA